MMYRTRVILIRCLRGVRKRICLNSTMMMCQAIQPNESEHDFFTVGHTSTSVSLAAGLAKARDLKGENGNVIAVIGDGSLSGEKHLRDLILLLSFKAILLL